MEIEWWCMSGLKETDCHPVFQVYDSINLFYSKVIIIEMEYAVICQVLLRCMS